MNTRFLVGLILACMVSLPRAEIEKFANSTNAGLNFQWWPKIVVPDGWHQDREQSELFSVNALAPDGSTFRDAETVMYARAIFKPRDPTAPTLEALIVRDNAETRTKVAGVTITEIEALTTGDGQALRTFTYIPNGSGNWETVSFGEEGEFYLLFAISSRSRQGHESATVAYSQLISRYRSVP